MSTRLVLALLLTSLASVRPASAATSRAAAKPAPVAAAPTPTTAGRWNLIPANDKLHARVAVLDRIADVLEEAL